MGYNCLNTTPINNTKNGLFRQNYLMPVALDQKTLKRDVKGLFTSKRTGTQPIYLVAEQFQKKLTQYRIARDRTRRQVPKSNTKLFKQSISPSIRRHPNTRSSTVLIFGKHSKYTRKLSTLLKRKFKTFESIVGKESLMIALTERPSLIILGPVISEAETLRFLEAFRQESSLQDIPVLLLVSQTPNWGTTPYANIIDEYLEVPIKPRKLMSSIEHMLKMRRPAKIAA